MTPAALLSHLLFALCLFVVSLAITRLMLARVRIMDVPGERSSHSMPTPKSGGISIVCTFMLGMAAIFLIADKAQIAHHYLWGFVLSAVAIAAISLYDDMTQKSFVVKLATQLIAVVIVLASGLVIDRIALPVAGLVTLGWVAYPLSFLWILGLTNAFNFMDGLDGLAGGAAVIATAFF